MKATLAQVIAAADAGADIVRICAPDQETTRALREICRESPVPIVADIHFHYKRAIEAAEAGAACLRINPGNIGDAGARARGHPAAKDHGCSIRIGVNAGSAWSGICWRNMASLARMRWWKAGWIISRSCRTTIFTSSRSA